MTKEMQILRRHQSLTHKGIVSDRIHKLLQPFNGLFFQDNLGKPAPERQNYSGF